MLSRTLLVALCIVYATPLTPLSTQGDDDCALYLTGPGRSSAYDYSLNLLKGNFAYDGQHTCITYEAINQAYLDARTRILVSQPKGDWKAENFASVGELLLDVSISLARIYGLTYEEIEKALPLIDTSRTLIREVCPPVFSHVECRAGKYRRLDGLCNNLRNPTWGATMAPFQRLIGPLFADGINAPRISHTGRDLPLSRVVSRTMHPDDGFHDHAGTVMVIAWGQFMDHDYTLTGTPLDPVHRNDPEECCKRPPHLKHPYCNEIRVPDDDYFYRLFGVKCIDFVRGFPSPRPGCRLGSRAPFNTLTGAIDGNTVYGVTEKFARKLRTGYGGLLRMNPVFKEYGLKDLLPLKLDIPDEGCTRPNKNMFCFEAGEIRVNEQLVLTVMHTLMAREHNRVAEALATVNPHWDDETLFQESRRINIAEIQHITYNEFLPILLGKDVMEKFGLVLEKEGYWDGYDQNVNPDVIASFAAAAYRFGHSLLPTAVERWSKAHKFIASKRLSDLIRRPYDLYRAGVMDEYVMGLMNQVAQAMDDSITQEVTNHLFKKVGARFGMDLVSFNMQRGREFGLPGYMEFRKFCGLPGADSFQDLFGSMANETIQKYESIFEHPIDVDLWSGGVSERPLPGSMLGPTFACIIATQFSYSRRGDRFWFELPNQPSSFTPEQIVELRKARLARVICDNTDIIDTVQLYPMVLPDHELNPRVPCRSGIIPSMDFSKWAEPTPFVGGAKEYMTDAHICNQTQDNTNITITSDNYDRTITDRDDCTTDDSSNDFLEQEDCKTDDQIIVTNNDDKENKTDTASTEHKTGNSFEQNCENMTGNLDIKLAKVKNSDTVLKYVYKKADINSSNKTRGHQKNSLKRKKRSLISDSEIHAHRHPRKFQITDQTDREVLAVPSTKPQGIINRDDLADFNIETLHENIKPAIDILMKDTQGFLNNHRQNHFIKKYGNNANEKNEYEDKSNVNIKSTFDNDYNPTKYNKKSKKVKSEGIVKDRNNLSQSGENNEHNKNDKQDIKTVYDKDIINDDYIGESTSSESNSNDYIENSGEKLPRKIDDGSSEYIRKDSKNIKSGFNKDDIRDGYTKEPEDDKNESNEYEIKNSRNIKSDSLNKDKRHNDYTKKPKSDNSESNEYEIKDRRNRKSDSFNNDDRRNDYTKKLKNDSNESNEYEIKDNGKIKIDSLNKDDRRNGNTKEPENDNTESDEYEIKNSRNIKSDSLNKDKRRNDYTKEPKNDNSESNEYETKDRRNIKSDSLNKDDRRNGNTKEPENDNTESDEYEIKNSRNIKSDSLNKDKRRNDYTKEPKNDNSESNEYETKDRRNIKSDSFNNDDRRNDYTKEPKNDNNESNEYEIKDSRKIKIDSFNKDDRRNDYIKEPKNDNNERNEYEIKDSGKIKKYSFNKDDRRNNYTKDPKDDNNESNEYGIKDSRNIKIDSFNKDDSRNDYAKEDKNDNNESNEYEINDSRNMKSDSFNKDDRRNSYTKEPINDNNESNEFEIKDSKKASINKDDRSNDYTEKSKNGNIKSNEYQVNLKNASFDKDDTNNDYTIESKNGNVESNEYEVKDRENIKSSLYNRNKQYSNIDEDKKAERNEEYLTDYKGSSDSDENHDADSFEKNIQTPRNNVINKNLDFSKKQPPNNKSENISNEPLKETRFDSNESLDGIESNNDTEGVTANKNKSINLKEVDLDDFSYESIQDENDQNIAPIINLNNNNERSFLPEHEGIIPNTLEKPFTGTNSKQFPLIENAFKNEKQIKINDDEIKPVKELNNSESQSEEESKEESINDRLRRVIEKSHKLHPISKAVNEKEKTDVKAQFERIPENYIHTDVKGNTTEKKPVVENIDEEGTLDAFTPNNYEYDKDLNIKFSDLTIKLPEIKLPKDILAYAREDTVNHKEDYDKSEDREKDNSEDKEKDNSEDKENEEEQEEDEELEEYNKEPNIHKNNKQNQEDFYQSYFNPPIVLSDDNSRTKEKYSNFYNENSGEDLYEKFVRERFGKRNDLKKRSEKLTNYEPVSKNYNLYKTVQKALKRANKIEKEAEKSKDPNYMWTLEYGGKL